MNQTKKEEKVEKLNAKLKESLSMEEYQMLSALMFHTLNKYFFKENR